MDFGDDTNNPDNQEYSNTILEEDVEGFLSSFDLNDFNLSTLLSGVSSTSSEVQILPIIAMVPYQVSRPVAEFSSPDRSQNSSSLTSEERDEVEDPEAEKKSNEENFEGGNLNLDEDYLPEIMDIVVKLRPCRKLNANYTEVFHTHLSAQPYKYLLKINSNENDLPLVYFSLSKSEEVKSKNMFTRVSPTELKKELSKLKFQEKDILSIKSKFCKVRKNYAKNENKVISFENTYEIQFTEKSLKTKCSYKMNIKDRKTQKTLYSSTPFLLFARKTKSEDNFWKKGNSSGDSDEEEEVEDMEEDSGKKKKGKKKRRRKGKGRKRRRKHGKKETKEEDKKIENEVLELQSPHKKRKLD